ncbi:MAG: hypothetical protein WC192_00555 [Candidatus Babeliales bacterium]|jgi:4-amino-4-deoxy-L-arabinose transferase-like glycosyltransferase
MIEVIKRYKWFLIGLFAFALFIRAAIFVGYLGKNQNFWQVDSNTYHLIAEQISQGHGICTDPGHPNFYRLPGYSLFLSAFYKIFGPDTKNVLWLQIFMAALIPLLIFLLGCILFPQNILIAKTAGIYGSIHIGYVLYSGFFMAESLFIFLFLIFAILFLSSVHLFFCFQNRCNCKESDKIFRYFSLPDPIATSEPYLSLFEDMFENEQKNVVLCNCQETELIKSSRNLLGAGFALGLASLVRPVGHYLICLSILILIFSNETCRQKISKSFTLFCGWIVPVIFWLARNFILTGHIFFHTLPGGHFLYFSASRVAMHECHCSYDQAKDILRKKVDEIVTQEEQIKHKKLSEIEQCDIRENLAKQYFKKYPALSIKLWLTDIFRTATSLYSAELLYIESGRKEIDYFNAKRTIKSMVYKYLVPQTEKSWLRWLIRLEILVFFLMILGLFLGFLRTVFRCIKNWDSEINRINLCSWLRSLAFATFFIVIGLAGGYARMRLPAEVFLIILSMSFWVPMLTEFKNKS